MCADTLSQIFSGFDDTYVNSVSSTFPSIADTGCQSCQTGFKVVHRLGLRESLIIPVTKKICTAHNGGIRILGAVLLRISCSSSTGQSPTT